MTLEQHPAKEDDRSSPLGFDGLSRRGLAVEPLIRSHRIGQFKLNLVPVDCLPESAARPWSNHIVVSQMTVDGRTADHLL
jgi:hypothetical protein